MKQNEKKLLNQIRSSLSYLSLLGVEAEYFVKRGNYKNVKSVRKIFERLADKGYLERVYKVSDKAREYLDGQEKDKTDRVKKSLKKIIRGENIKIEELRIGNYHSLDDKNPGIFVALKFTKPPYSFDPSISERIKKEIRKFNYEPEIVVVY